MDSDSKKLSTKKSCHKLHNRANQEEVVGQTWSKHDKPDRSRCKSGLGKKMPTKTKLQTNNNDNQMNVLLKESYQYLKEQNQALSQQLKKKVKKIEEMKEAIKVYETRMQCFEEAIGLLKCRGEGDKETEQTLAGSRKKYEQMIKESQQIAKQSIDKYRKLQKQIQDQRLHYEKIIDSLREENAKLSEKRSYRYSTSKENHILQESRGSLVTTDKKNKKSHSSHKQISSPNPLEQQFKAKEQEWSRKEEHLRKILSQISSKVDSYESKCRITQERARLSKLEMQELKQRYKKSKQSNEKWGKLFKDLMKETVGTKKQIDDVKKILMKIIRRQAKQLQKQ